MKSVEANIDLYGYPLKFSFPLHELNSTDSNVEREIISIWNSPSSDSFISDLKQTTNRLQMDDMSLLMMMNKITSLFYGSSDNNHAIVFKYAILSKMGFDVLLGKKDCGYTLYALTNFYTENCLFVVKNNKRYYDLSFNQKGIPTAETRINIVYNTKAKLRPLVMNMIQPPAFKANFTAKSFHFEYEGFLYFFHVKINQSLVDYYHELPPVNIGSLYLNYGLSEEAKSSLISQLKRSVSTMTVSKGVDFILKFTQFSFEYQSDMDAYGQEKFSFPEETLVNPFADCEDKAMLFAYLINETMGLKTIGIYYKNANHINIAVESWNKKQKGNIVFEDHKYIICEPTGNGFSAGENSLNDTYANVIDW